MNDKKKRIPTRTTKQLGRKSKNTFVTKSGQAIKINRSLTEKLKARKEDYARRRAERLAGMPKSRIKRFFYRLHPKRMYKYWFSREGGIMALKVAGIGIIAGFLLMIGVFAYFRKDLPNLRDISGSNIGGSIRYFDKTGETLLWEDYDAVKRIPVKDEDINQFVKDATIAVEDKDFFKHGGFDVRGIARAGWNNAFGGSTTQGGSTITQQLVRLTQRGVGKEQTYTRKIKEVILSIELERTYTKQEILTGYLNTAPYGNVQYGVEAATRDYFQKSAKELTLDEAAFLAAIPQSPSYYSPYGPIYEPEALIGRQHYILDLMEQQGMITREQRDEAKKVDTIAKVHEVQPKYEGITAPWFVLTAKEELEREYGAETVQRGGWKVITTLDLPLQRLAEEQVQKGLPQIRRQGGDSAGFVAEDVKTGQVVALVGGSDFTNDEYGEFNFGRAKLPPGSSFKPYDYVALIEHNDNFGAGTVLYDTQGPIDGYPCTNKARPQQGGNCLWDYDFRYPGPMTLRYALGGSRNVPAVKAMLITGVDKTIETASKLMGDEKDGYKCYRPNLEDISKATAADQISCYASSAIGDGAYLQMDEHVHGYATISRNGNRLPMTYIKKIEDAAGKTVKEWKLEKGEQVVREDSAYIVADMMEDPNASYFPHSRKPHRFNGSQGQHRFAMKTGTTNDGKDGWMMGFSTQYSAGVWVGYHTRQKEMSGTMENMTQPIWQGWMQGAHRDLKPENRPKPAGVQTLPAFIVRSNPGLGAVVPSTATDLFPSWFQKKATTGKKETIDIVSNKLATDCTPARAKKEINNADANQFSGDSFVSGNRNAVTNATDDVHKCEDQKPTVRVTVSGGTVQADITQGTHPLHSAAFPGTVNFIIDGQVVKSANVTGSGVVEYDAGTNFTGSKQITVEVIDSVLYDDTDTGTIAGTGGGGGSLTITSPSNGTDVNGNTTTVTWSGGSGPYTVTYDPPHLTGGFIAYPGCNGNTPSCDISTTQSGDYRVRVQDSDGNSDTVDFEK